MEAKEITDIGTEIAANYDMRLIVLAIVIAVVGSYTALDLAGQVPVAQGRARKFWLAGGALALGISIWVIHFVAMLAYQLPIPITYDFSIVLVSMAVAIVGSGIGLFFATQLPLSWLMLSSAGVVVGSSIIGMHYTATRAMLLAAEPKYDFKLVLLSDLCAVGLSVCAMWLTFHPNAQTTVPVESIRKIGSAFLAGTAIYGMHYIAMAAVNFYPSTKNLGVVDGISNYVLAITIGTAVLSILMLALLASFFGKRLSAEIARLEALRLNEERYQNLFDFAPDGCVKIAPDGTLLSVNQSAAESLGYQKQELINSSAWNLIYDADREWFQQQVATIFSEKLITSEVELRKVRKDGSVFWERQRSQLLFDESGTPTELRMICRNITDRKQMEEQMRQNAFHDALTGLPNRVLFMDRLAHALEHSKRHKDYLFAVLFLDLDGFKAINDSLGHLLGDQLLIGIAQKLKACLRPMDTVARFGGDEFTILIEDIQDSRDAIKVAERVQEALALPFELGGQKVFACVSIGIALSATRYDSPENLLRDADVAMYRAKSQSSANYEIFYQGRLGRG